MDVAAAIWEANPGRKSVHIVFDPEAGKTSMDAKVEDTLPSVDQHTQKPRRPRQRGK